MGLENIKKVLAFSFSLAKAIDLARADGKIDYTDVQYLLAPAMKVVDAVAGAKQALAEIKDLSVEERAQLDAYIKAEFDISDDELEVKIEKGLALALHVAEFVAVL